MTVLPLVLGIALGILIGIWFGSLPRVRKRVARDLLHQAFVAGFRAGQESSPKDGSKTRGHRPIADRKQPLRSHQELQALSPLFALDPFLPGHRHFPSPIFVTNPNITYRTH